MSKELIVRLREAAAQRVASTAMIGADDLIAAADALEIATAGMNAYCDELGSCRKAAGFGSADDPMAQEGFGAFSDPLCVAAFVESQFKRIVAERAALAAELKALREQELLEALRTFESSPKPGAFRIGDLVKKVSGSAWEGRIVGTYSTALTPEGYAVESASHPGSVQIYPAKALTLVIQEAGIQPTEGQHAQHVDVSGENVNATFRISKQIGADALVGLRGCNRRHGGMRAVEPCGYRMRTTDPGCTGCADRDEDQPTKAGDSILGEQK